MVEAHMLTDYREAMVAAGQVRATHAPPHFRRRAPVSHVPPSPARSRFARFTIYLALSRAHQPEVKAKKERKNSFLERKSFRPPSPAKVSRDSVVE